VGGPGIGGGRSETGEEASGPGPAVPVGARRAPVAGAPGEGDRLALLARLDGEGQEGRVVHHCGR